MKWELPGQPFWWMGGSSRSLPSPLQGGVAEMLCAGLSGPCPSLCGNRWQRWRLAAGPGQLPVAPFTLGEEGKGMSRTFWVCGLQRGPPDPLSHRSGVSSGTEWKARRPVPMRRGNSPQLQPRPLGDVPTCIGTLSHRLDAFRSTTADLK